MTLFWCLYCYLWSYFIPFLNASITDLVIPDWVLVLSMLMDSNYSPKANPNSCYSNYRYSYWESENVLVLQLSQWDRKQDTFVDHTKLLNGTERLQALVLLLVILQSGLCNILHLDAKYRTYAQVKLEEFFRRQKATTLGFQALKTTISRFRDQNAMTLSFWGILRLLSSDNFL